MEKYKIFERVNPFGKWEKVKKFDSLKKALQSLRTLRNNKKSWGSLYYNYRLCGENENPNEVSIFCVDTESTHIHLFGGYAIPITIDRDNALVVLVVYPNSEKMVEILRKGEYDFCFFYPNTTKETSPATAEDAKNDCLKRWEDEIENLCEYLKLDADTALEAVKSYLQIHESIN